MAAANCICGHRIEAPSTTESSDVYAQRGGRALIDDLPGVGSLSNPGHDDVFCKSCSTSLLAAKISRYKSAIENRRIERMDFERRLLATRLVDSNAAGEELSFSTTRALPDPSHIHQQVYNLRERLDNLRSISNELAIQVTSKTMENDERQAQFEVNYAKIDLARERLDSMRQNLLLSTVSAQNSTEEKKAESLHQNVDNIGGGLRDALVFGTRQIQKTRFFFALRVFEMHRIDVGEEYSNLTIDDETANHSKVKSTASGVGKIGGLPLPHAGPALFGVLPPGMLASSLRLVASLTNLLASCLGVVLPHPILVYSKECVRCNKAYKAGGDVIGMVCESDDDESIHSNLCSSCERDDFKEASEYHELHKEHSHPKHQPSGLLQKIPSKSSVLSFVGSSARKAVALATGSATSASSISTPRPNPKFSENTALKSVHTSQSTLSKITPASAVARRVSYASFAVLIENHESGAAEYILNPPRWKEEKKHPSETDQPFSSHQTQLFTNREEFHAAEEKFSTGLQLLQNDVVALCFRAGVDASKLWPAESLLLNLYSLLCHCAHVVNS
jgi:hypothetical protein